MEQWIHHVIQELPLYALFAIIVVTLYTLGKGADWLVEEAVILSVRWGVPKVLIGATIVSLGTTTPEAAVSVLAAIKGNPDFALGNAVGSIICDTGLILGTAALIAPLPLNRRIVNRQGWLQLGAGVLLVVSCLFVGSEGRHLPQFMGFVFLILLVAYLWQSIRWSRDVDQDAIAEDVESAEGNANAIFVVLKLVFAIAVVVASSWILIPAAKETALRLHVPQSIIAASIVALGTSLPEFVTAVTAARRGHGELAVGNVIGADILNVLFVAGVSAAVTTGGLVAASHFFVILFPTMLFILVVFRIGIFTSGDTLKRPFGVVLIGAYVAVMIVSYVFRSV
ncbi:MAG: sodium:calcium antiporter [Candidatus Poribacteria bacterium]|nr:sodium:calcium antiporter [Candidatus Poribacteria bacterium]MDE0506395.1 sodium:calcium antiporter [Candidatus Poribacteria bacterium]